MSGGFERLMGEVAREHERSLEEGDELREVRARLAAPRRRARRRPRAAWLAAAACLLAAPILWWVWPRPEAITYTVGAASEPAPAGHWIQVAAAEPRVPLRFSDGSRLELQPDSDLEVAALTPRGARVRLERGRVDASVEHRDETGWTVDAGPFELTIVGTRFSVAWDPVAARFELVMQQGVVLLTGPLVERRRVVAGERVEVSLRQGRVELRAAESEPEPEPAPTAEPRPADRAPSATAAEASSEPPAPPPEPAAVEERPAASPAEPARPSVGFERHARAGRYAEAVEAAERAGWSETLETAPSASLLHLADAARLAGRPERAQGAYEAVRRRFAYSPRAARAAFALGRLAHDRGGDPRAAARWFATYLDEAPHGELAREAAGRLMEARVDAGDLAGARAAAARYLRSHPDGPHAELARSLRERP